MLRGPQPGGRGALHDPRLDLRVDLMRAGVWRGAVAHGDLAVFV